MTSFSETRLELGLTYGASYGPRFSTAINAQANGVEIAEAEWEDPLIQINLPDKAYTRSETEYLLDFHATMKGSLTGFRIRDWSDYFVTGQAIGTGNGTVQDWQLIKTYTVGSYSVKRAITKPVAGSLVVYVNGVVTNSGWSVDTTTGKFTTELTGAISVNFEFDVPVRFVEDKLDFRFDAVQGNNALFTQQPITLTEIRVTPWAYPSLDPFPVSLSHQIDLGYDLGTTGGPEFDTFIAETAGEWESRVARRDNPLGVWNLGDRTLTRSQANYLIALFRIARGRAIPFGYLDYQEETVKLVRFTEDRLGVSFLAHRHSDKQAIFSLAAIGIKASNSDVVMIAQMNANYYPDMLVGPVINIKALGNYGGPPLPVIFGNTEIYDNPIPFVPSVITVLPVTPNTLVTISVTDGVNTVTRVCHESYTGVPLRWGPAVGSTFSMIVNYSQIYINPANPLGYYPVPAGDTVIDIDREVIEVKSIDGATTFTEGIDYEISRANSLPIRVVLLESGNIAPGQKVKIIFAN